MSSFDERLARRTVLAGIGAAGLAGAATVPANAQSEVETEFRFGGSRAFWRGQAPESIEGVENPTLELEAGKRYRVVWENLDGEAHNWVIEDADGNNIVRTEIISEEGATQTVEFEATAAMASYYCEVHPTSMRGPVEVSGGTSDTSTPTETPAETPTPVGEADHTVSMVTEGSEYYFDPIGLAVEPGDTVEWVIESGSHSSTSYDDRIPEGAKPWDSGVLSEEGATFRQTFETEGTYDYFCTPHKTLGMVGRVVVGEPGGPAEGSMPPDGDVPASDAVVDEGSVSYDSFAGQATDTPTPDSTPTEADDGGDGGSNGDGPGFGIVGTLVGLGSAGAYLLGRGGDDE
ncbi:MAG: plastocyanin/azurin family copper-binding protein [Haloarculaceae archaeon]